MDRNTAAATAHVRRPRSHPSLPEPRAALSPRAAAAPSPQLHTDLLAILLCLVGALLALGLYQPGSAGGVGIFLVQFFRFWMGHVVHAAPLLFFAGGIVLALDYRRATSPQLIIGIAGLLAAVFGTVHLMTTEEGAVFASTAARLAALLGKRYDPGLLTAPDGGFLGACAMRLTLPMGVGGAYITYAAIAAASFLLVTDLTIRTIAERVHERSRAAADRTRARAAAIGDRCRQVASSLPERRTLSGRQKLFLEVGGKGESEQEREKRHASLLRALQEAESELPTTAQPGPQTALVLVDPDGTPPDAITRKLAPARARTPKAPPPAPADPSDYVYPPVELLDAPVPRPKRLQSEAEANIEILEGTLGQFKIEAQVVEIADGPSVTRYEIRLGEGIRVKKITDLADNIAMSLAAMSVRVEAPIPGKAAIGIEVPKKQPAVVTLRECLESPEFKDHKSRIAFVLGKDVSGEVRCADLARMPHLLVAGATNSGKSVCLNALIASMLFRSRPDELKMIMIDPKRVELTLFEGIPHLIHPVVKDVKQASGILRWVLKEMDHRYDLFARVMTRNIDNYNEKVASEPEKRLPFIVVVIDELADLMMQQGPEVEQSICRLAQLARATGIHLVVATQRPSVDVITGLIKANVPSRISFAVTSQIDSRTILDGKGAESLVGRGDMLFKPVDAAKPIRIQGAFLREAEVDAIVAHLRKQGKPDFVAEALSVDHGAYGTASEGESEDELFEPSARFIVTTGHASTSMIQRKFKIGYTRAARLVDMMESRGILGPLDGPKPREILMNREVLDQMFLNTRDSLFRGVGADYDEDEELVEVEETIEPASDPFVE